MNVHIRLIQSCSCGGYYYYHINESNINQFYMNAICEENYKADTRLPCIDIPGTSPNAFGHFYGNLFFFSHKGYPLRKN